MVGAAGDLGGDEVVGRLGGGCGIEREGGVERQGILGC